MGLPVYARWPHFCYFERDDKMALSSILTNVVIKDKESAERFIDALEKASKDPKRVPTSEVPPPLTDKDAIRALFQRGLGYKLEECTYSIIINRDTYVVTIPDFDIKTQGKDIENCIEIAVEAIGLTGVSLEDAGKHIPFSSQKLPKISKNEIGVYVTVDFNDYRNKKDENVVLKSSLTTDEIEENFKDVDVYSGIMQGLNEALEYNKSKKKDK